MVTRHPALTKVWAIEMNLPRIPPETTPVIQGRKAAEEMPRRMLKMNKLPRRIPSLISLDQKASRGTKAEVAMKMERSPHPARAKER